MLYLLCCQQGQVFLWWKCLESLSLSHPYNAEAQVSLWQIVLTCFIIKISWLKFWVIGINETYVGYPVTSCSEHNLVAVVQSTSAIITFSSELDWIDEPNSCQVGFNLWQWPHLFINKIITSLAKHSSSIIITQEYIPRCKEHNKMMVLCDFSFKVITIKLHNMTDTLINFIGWNKLHP